MAHTISSDGAAVVASAAARVVGHFGAQPQDGFPAKWERQASATPSVYDAYSCHGVTVLAEAVGASGEGNRLVLIGQDLVTRSKRRRDAHQEEHPMMREAVTYEGGGDDESGASGGGSGGGGGYTGGAQDATMGKVWAISERPVALSDNPSAARLRALLVTSRTPSHAEINGRSGAIGGGGGGWGGWGGGRGRERGGVFFFSAGASRQSSGSGSRKVNGGRASATSTSTALVVRGATTGGAVGDVSAGIVNRAMQWRKSEAYPERPVAPAPPLVCSPGGSRGCPGGLVQKDVARVVALPELGTQSYSERRELLCLTSAGLQTFVKLRAVDLLYDLLAQNQAEKVMDLFWGRGGGGGSSEEMGGIRDDGWIVRKWADGQAGGGVFYNCPLSILDAIQYIVVLGACSKLISTAFTFEQKAIRSVVVYDNVLLWSMGEQPRDVSTFRLLSLRPTRRRARGDTLCCLCDCSTHVHRKINVQKPDGDRGDERQQRR